MKDTVSATLTTNELGSVLEIVEGGSLSWENTLFIRVIDSKLKLHKREMFLLNHYPYSDDSLSQKELDEFKYFMLKALESEGVSVVKCGDIPMHIAHQGDKYGISIKDRKWMLSKDDVQLLVKFCSQ